MHKVEELAYVGINANDVDEWTTYATDVLGHEISSDSDSNNVYLRMDDHHHRLIVHPSDVSPEDVAYVGWQVRSAEALTAISARLEAASVAVTQGTPEEAATRRVLDFVHFLDPNSGVRMELSYGPEITFQPTYRPTRSISGYLTEDMGLGHFVTYVSDVLAAEEFYRSVLGFGTSDATSIPGIGRVGTFMYCNPRHHSLAFFMNPQAARRTNHIMLQHTSIDDVGSAYDICKAREEVKVELGRHSNDRMISFYTRNPSGWYFELGWGARKVDPETFSVEHYTLSGGSGMGEWGHAGLTGLV